MLEHGILISLAIVILWFDCAPPTLILYKINWKIDRGLKRSEIKDELHAFFY